MAWILTAMTFVLASVPSALAVEGAWVSSGQANARLLASEAQVDPGESIWIALELELPEGWHTYWRNPGDSGAPPSLTYSLPSGVTLREIQWVPPEIIPFGPLINLGYKRHAIYAQALTLPADFTGEVVDIKLQGRWLVCEAVCIPEQATLELNLPVGSETSARSTSGTGDDLTRAGALPKNAQTWLKPLQALWPKPLPGASVVVRSGEVSVRLPASVGSRSANAQLTYLPYAAEAIDLTMAQNWQLSGEGGQIELRLPLEAEAPGDMSGLVLFEEIVAGETLSGAFEVIDVSMQGGEIESLNILTAMLFALLGGLILNLMPCVFPVLSIKVLGLIQGAKGGRNLSAGLSYGAGVVFSFLALAGTLLILRGLGENLGWGFQLQWPWMVGTLALVFVLLGLNLSGYFELGIGVQSVAGNLDVSQGKATSFWTGVLAVIVAAPCTAPFMGAALGYAMTQPPWDTAAIFFALGLGMAIPMMILTSFPRLLAGLPKPGPWMLRLKEGLAFPMYLSALWLVWVLSGQAGGVGLLIWGALLIGCIFLIWVGKQIPRYQGGLWLIAVLLVPLGLAQLQSQQTPGGRLESALPPDRSSSGSDRLAYSDAAVALALAEGHPVFVDFTADWCITCKVNERLAIQTADTQQLFEELGVVVLVADWTNEDAAITQTLSRFGRLGVPLYLLYQPGDTEPQILPQILTSDIIRDALLSDGGRAPI